ncbi:MAG: hypothetical protein IJJ71_11145 [Treponema sp.]|uniref:hypothetical protein n=1 Tax=Treponema sp. TaxID=166 RepID=UPI0025E1C1AB|nr:hypothetical protein [Treponema sp.]MBQ9623692.1 hypothetical protein [Treponema sp.]MBR0496719.1 hypothetical protein [Treponema sp.]
MSKKTEQIYKAIATLEDLQNQISIINQLEKSKEDSELTEAERAEKIRHLENIEFEMGQSLKSLRFWIGSLYSYNGKSTSRAKIAASQENGKKGGRPPKRITDMKKRSVILEETLASLKKEKLLTTDFDRENEIEAEISGYENELERIREEIEIWNQQKK